MSSKYLIAKVVVVTLITGFCFWGCKKDVATAKPILTFKSINTYEVQQGGSLSILLECNDITNLATDTGINVNFTMLNKISSCSINGGTQTRSTVYALPDITGSTSSTSKIQLNWDGSSLNGIPGNKCRPTDTTQIKIWVISKTGIASDTVVIGSPVVIHN